VGLNHDLSPLEEALIEGDGESAKENGLERQKQIEGRIKLHSEQLRHILVTNWRVGKICMIHLFENARLYFTSKFCGEEALDNIQVRHVEVLWDRIEWLTYERERLWIGSAC
jgi:hypothetical protein